MRWLLGVLGWQPERAGLKVDCVTLQLKDNAIYRRTASGHFSDRAGIRFCFPFLRAFHRGGRGRACSGVGSRTFDFVAGWLSGDIVRGGAGCRAAHRDDDGRARAAVGGGMFILPELEHEQDGARPRQHF